MLKVDIRNRILKPKVGEIITVIGDIYTTVAETISCNGCAFRKGDLESMCKAYLCFSERTLDCFGVQESKVEIQTKCYRVLKVKVLI